MTDWRIQSPDDHFDKDELVEFLARIFGPNYHDARAAQRIVFANEPSLRPENLFEARAPDGALIGLVRLVEREILLGGVSLSAVGVSSVAVHLQWRSQGVASALINAAVAEAARRGFCFSFLHGRRAVDGYYLKHGYVGIGRYVDLELLSQPETAQVLVQAEFVPTHLPMCAERYRETYGLLAGAVVRGPGVWEYLLKRRDARLGGFEIKVCLDGEAFAGYLVVAGGKLVEMALEPHLYPAVPRALRSMGVESIAMHPRHPFVLYCRRNLNTVYSERFALNGGYMARLLDLKALLKAMAPVMSSRAAAAGAGGETLCLLGYEVDLATGRAREFAGGDDLVFDCPEMAVRTLLGVDALTESLDVHWPDGKPWIPALLPGTGFHTSSWDEV